MEAPGYIRNSGLVGTAIKHQWRGDLAIKFIEAINSPDRLFRAIEKSLVSAQYALGLAAAEWTARRFEGLGRTSEALQRIEAGWARLVHTDYTKALDYELSENLVFALDEAVDGPLQMVATLIESLDYRFTGKSRRPITEPATNQAKLAQHVLPKKKVFEAWLEPAVLRCAQHFPNTGDPYLETDLPVVRELCDPDFDYTPEAAADAKKTFLASLDWKSNPYLNSPDEMTALGFTGTPYVD